MIYKDVEFPASEIIFKVSYGWRAFECLVATRCWLLSILCLFLPQVLQNPLSLKKRNSGRTLNTQADSILTYTLAFFLRGSFTSDSFQPFVNIYASSNPALSKILVSKKEYTRCIFSTCILSYIKKREDQVNLYVEHKQG